MARRLLKGMEIMTGKTGSRSAPDHGLPVKPKMIRRSRLDLLHALKGSNGSPSRRCCVSLVRDADGHQEARRSINDRACSGPSSKPAALHLDFYRGHDIRSSGDSTSVCRLLLPNGPPDVRLGDVKYPRFGSHFPRELSQQAIVSRPAEDAKFGFPRRSISRWSACDRDPDTAD